MNRPRTRWIVIAVLAVAAGGLALFFLPQPIPVDTAKAVVGPIAETVQDQGSTRVREAYMVAAPVSGRLDRIDLHVGDRVIAAKTIVAQLHPSPPEMLDPRARAQAQANAAAASAAVAAARASRERLAAESARADQTLVRTRELAEIGYVSKQALDDAIATAKASKAAVAAADAELAARRAQLVSAQAALLGPRTPASQIVTVTSPATGYVTRVLQESERVVPMGAPLLEVGESQGLEAQIEFLSQDAVRISEGMPAEVYGWGGQAIPATVRRVEPEGFVKTSALGVEEHRVLVMLQFAGPPELWAKMGPGYSVWGRVFLRREDKALKVPLGALVGSGAGWAVFRVVDGHAKLTTVTVGAITDTEAEIRAGLAAGDSVVTFPSDRVRDGIPLKSRSAG